jgi:predicted helicase
MDALADRHAGLDPEDVFEYIYAVLHSPEYRSRYAEFLRADFPRIPLTSRRELFESLRDLGAELVALHLMEADPPPVASFPVPGDNRVEVVRYAAAGQGAPNGRVLINASQYFAGVPEDVWRFEIGGYQVLEKWLKDRKGRTLTYEDLDHYRLVVGGLVETIRIMREIDSAIEQHGGWPIR